MGHSIRFIVARISIIEVYSKNGVRGQGALQLTFPLHFFPPKQECRIFLTFFTTSFKMHFGGFTVMMASLSAKNSLKIAKNA